MNRWTNEIEKKIQKHLQKSENNVEVDENSEEIDDEQ